MKQRPALRNLGWRFSTNEKLALGMNFCQYHHAILTNVYTPVERLQPSCWAGHTGYTHEEAPAQNVSGFSECGRRRMMLYWRFVCWMKTCKCTVNYEVNRSELTMDNYALNYDESEAACFTNQIMILPSRSRPTLILSKNTQVKLRH